MVNSNDDDPSVGLFEWFEHEQNIDNWLDGVEACLKYIDKEIRGYWMAFDEHVVSEPDEVIDEFNARLREAGIGYEYVDGMIIRNDSEFIHREVVLPALTILNEPRFEAANKEFRDAHEAFRHARFEDSIVNSGKALESVLKVIGDSRRWRIKGTDTVGRLVQAAVEAGFLAAYS